MIPKILKYTLSMTDEQRITIPANSVVLSAGLQENAIRVWVLADQDQPLLNKTFRIVGTGHPLEHDFNGKWLFVGRIDMAGSYTGQVYHVFVLHTKYEQA